MKLNPKVKAGCGVLTVFILGFGLGFLSLLFLIVKMVPLSEGWKTRESKEFVANHIANQLKLNEEQRTQFDPLVFEMLDRRWGLRREYLLEDRNLMEKEFIPRARAILTPEQQERARKLMERWRRDQRFKVDSSAATSDKGEEKDPKTAPGEK